MQTPLIGRSFSLIEKIGLLAILLATLFAGFSEVRQMVEAGHAGVSVPAPALSGGGGAGGL